MKNNKLKISKMKGANGMKNSTMNGANGNNEIRLTCGFCNGRFSQTAYQISHMHCHLGGKAHLCELCGKGFSQIGNLNRHRSFCEVIQSDLGFGNAEAASETLKKAFECDICKSVFNSRKDLKSHLHIHIKGEVVHKCSLCDKKFQNKGALQGHLLVHSRGKPYKCELCDKRFTQICNRNAHTRSFHNRERSRMCKVCQKRFPTGHILQRHRSRGNCQKVVKAYAMHRPLQPFSTNPLICVHYRGKKFSCNVCGKKFLHKYKLKKHMKYQRENKQQRCESCAKILCTSYDLKVHIQTHSDAKTLHVRKVCKDQYCKMVENATQKQATKESNDKPEESVTENAEDIDDKEVKSNEVDSDAEPMYISTKMNLGDDVIFHSPEELEVDILGTLAVPHVQAKDEQSQNVRFTNDTPTIPESKHDMTAVLQENKAEKIKLDDVESMINTHDKDIENMNANYTDSVITDMSSETMPALSGTKQVSSQEIVVNEGIMNNKDQQKSTGVSVKEQTDCISKSVEISKDFEKDNISHVDFTSEQNSKHLSAYQDKAINICSQANFKLLAANGSFVQSDQAACIVKICGGNGISIQTGEVAPVKNCVEKVYSPALTTEHSSKDLSKDENSEQASSILQTCLENGISIQSEESAHLKNDIKTLKNQVVETEDSTSKMMTNDESESFSSILQICGENGIRIQNEDVAPVKSNDVKVESKSAINEHNKKDMLISGGMLDIHTMFNTKQSVCEQKLDNVPHQSAGADMDSRKEASDMETVQYGPVNEHHSSIETVVFGPHKYDGPKFGPEHICDLKDGPETIFNGNLSPIRSCMDDTQHATTSGKTQFGGASISDEVQYGPVNIFDEHYCPTQFKDLPLDSSSRCGSPIQFGPLNIGDIQFGPPNLNELHYGQNSGNRDQLNLYLNEPQNDVSSEGVQYGPLNFSELVLSPSKSISELKSPDIGEVKYGPATFEEASLSSVFSSPANKFSSVLESPDTFYEGEIRDGHKNEVMFGPANFNEVNSDPLNIDTPQQQSVSFNEEHFVPYGPPNLCDLEDYHIKYTCNENLDKAMVTTTDESHDNANADCLNSSLMEFPHLNYKLPNHSDINDDQSKSNEQSNSVYTTVGGINLGPVHELTNMIVNSCENASPDGPIEWKSENTVHHSKESQESKRSELSGLDKLPNRKEVKAVEVLSNKDESRTKDKDSKTVKKEVAVNENETLQATRDLCTIIASSENSYSSDQASVTGPSQTIPPVSYSSDQASVTGPSQTTLPDSYFSCEICSQMIHGQETMLQHMLTHSDEKTHICTACFKTFSALGSLNHHMKLCKVLSSNTGVLEAANGPATNNSKSLFVCTICKEGFLLKSQLKKHMLFHVDKDLPKCDICGELFKQKSTLQSHLRTHTGEKPFKCKFCEKSFQQSGQLNVHVRSCHTGEKPYVCNICSKGYSDKSHFQRHMDSHTGEKSFVCEVCNKAFGQKDYLKQHMKTHRKVKEDVCDVCNKAFFSKANLKRHMLKHGIK